MNNKFGVRNLEENIPRNIEEDTKQKIIRVRRGTSVTRRKGNKHHHHHHHHHGDAVEARAPQCSRERREEKIVRGREV